MEILTQSDLRAFVLSASVLHDLDLLPSDDGILLSGIPPLAIELGRADRGRR